MEKDITITRLIETLKQTINFTSLEVVDYWEADLCAVGLKKGDRLVYISTFNYVNSSEIKYDYDLELLDENNADKIEVIKQQKGVSENELRDAISNFLMV